MASLSRLGGNAHVAKRILRLLSTHLPGRVVLRLGAAKWQAQATGGEFATAVGSKASLQWAASRLWAAGTCSEPHSRRDANPWPTTRIILVNVPCRGPLLCALHSQGLHACPLHTAASHALSRLGQSQDLT